MFTVRHWWRWCLVWSLYVNWVNLLKGFHTIRSHNYTFELYARVSDMYITNRINNSMGFDEKLMISVGLKWLRKKMITQTQFRRFAGDAPSARPSNVSICKRVVSQSFTHISEQTFAWRFDRITEYSYVGTLLSQGITVVHFFNSWSKQLFSIDLTSILSCTSGALQCELLKKMCGSV